MNNVDNNKNSILTYFHLGTLAIDLQKHEESIEHFKKID